MQGEWTSQCEGAFVKLKESLTRAPVLAYADPHKPYELHVDASREGLGGVLYQEYGGLLRPVLKRLHEEGLKLSLEKCQFCLPSVTYLGHVVSAEGVSTDPRKLEAVASWPRPRNVTELSMNRIPRKIYRRFVGGFAKIAQPLNKLLQKETTEEGCKVSDQNPSAPGPRKARESIQGEWTSQCEGAFVKLKESLTRAPVLAYADPHKPYELHVDASREGLGGVLYQEYGGLLRPVAYVSRSLTPSEKNYPTHKLEFLALKWTVVDKLKDYLYGAEFVINFFLFKVHRAPT
uniref:Reverse transcriptase/retrotransposon-derived protein RNase H-like domain-containing protein n=1 Tax=Leptobrachium leishanense TaxID=445787 RepID=A0A8C5MHF9_9ANUR